MKSRTIRESSVPWPERAMTRCPKPAGQVLISALAFPDLSLAGAGKDEGVEFEGLRDRVGRMSSLFGLSRTPTREGLLKEAVSIFYLYYTFHC